MGLDFAIRMAWTQLWQVSILALIVGILVWLGCRRRPHLAHLLWMLVIVKSLTPPLLSSPTSVFGWAELQVAEPVWEGHRDESVTRLTATVPPPAPIDPARIPGNSFASAPAHSDGPVAVGQQGKPPRLPRFSIAAILAVAWLAGSIGFLSLILRRWFALHHAVHHTTLPVDAAVQSMMVGLANQLGLRRNVRLVISSQPIGPAAFGLFRPSVILPRTVLAGKTPKQIEPIVAHELIHVRRRDALWGTLQVLAEAIWWFHPLVWWANRQACEHRERCCDEEVVAWLKCKPATYARCLLDVLALTRRTSPVPAVPGVHSARVTSTRLEDIMRRRNRYRRRTPAWCWAVLLTLAAIVLPGRQLVLGGAQSADPKQASPAGSASAEASKTVIIGRVLDAEGRTVPQAQVALVARSRKPNRGGDFQSGRPKPLQVVRTDASGAFRLAIPRVSAAAFFYANVVAAKPGYGVGWESLPLAGDPDELTIRLPDEQIVRGRLVDDQGKPAAGARVYVRWIGRTHAGETEGTGPREPREDFPAWPKSTTTDGQGRFAIRGVSREDTISLRVVDERFATWDFYIKPLGEQPPEEDPEREQRTQHLAKASESVYSEDDAQELVLSPPRAQIIEGAVVCGDTGEPVAHARLTAYAKQSEIGSAVGIDGRADANGRFRLRPYPGKIFELRAYPPNDQPYLVIDKTVAWREGADRHKVDLTLPRGVLVRGQVTEQSSGRPVEGAAVQYQAQHKNPHAVDSIVTGWLGMVVSDSQGAFRIVVPAGKGSLLIHGPTRDYVQTVIGSNDIYYGRPGGQRWYVHAIVALDLTPGAEAVDVSVSVERGVTVKGRLLGPQGERIADAIMLSPVYISASDKRYRGHAVKIREGRFELPGCHPDKTIKTFFLDPINHWGAVVDVSGEIVSSQPLEVRLEPCGTAKVRYVDAEGKPVADLRPSLQIVMTPGHHSLGSHSRKVIERGEWFADQDFVANFDRHNYWDGPRTDKQGRVTLPVLIPNATYRVYTLDEASTEASTEWAAVDFTVASGETTDLPDMIHKSDK